MHQTPIKSTPTSDVTAYSLLCAYTNHSILCLCLHRIIIDKPWIFCDIGAFLFFILPQNVILFLKENMTTAHYLSMEEPSELFVNDFVDYRYDNGRYILCKIMAKDWEQNIIKLHPMSRPMRDMRYDKFCNITDEYTRLAPARSVSFRKIQSKQHVFANLKVGDCIDVNPVYLSGHEGWKVGKICKLDRHSSQVKVLYRNDNDGRDYSYWVHLESINEVAEFRTKTKDLDDEKSKAAIEPVKDVGKHESSPFSMDMNYGGQSSMHFCPLVLQ